MRIGNPSAVVSRLGWALAIACALLSAGVWPQQLTPVTPPSSLDGTPLREGNSIGGGLSSGGIGSSSSSRSRRDSRSDRRSGTSALNSSSSQRNRNQRDASTGTSRNRRDGNRTNRNADAGKAAAAPGAAGTPARAQAGQARSVVRRQAQGGGGGGQGGGDAVPLPEISVMAGTKEHALYFTPPQLTVNVGDKLATGLEYYNPESSNVDSLDLWVRYDPEFLEPEWIDTEAIATSGGAPARATVWREQGYLHLEAPLAAPLSSMLNKIAMIHWRALNPVATTRVEAVAPGGETAALRAGAENVLAAGMDLDRGRLSADIHIIDPAREVRGLKLDSYEARQDAGLDVAPVEGAEPMRLAIVPARDAVAAGEVSTADIMLLNPAAQALDTIRLRIRYDPAAVKILDADDANYILNGINLYDGGFHEQFPFDFHAANSVDPDRGVIDYWMGVNSTPRVYPDGTFARIVFRMLRQTGEAAFWFEPTDTATRAAATDVSAGGRSLLGEDREAATRVLHGARIQSRPLALP